MNKRKFKFLGSDETDASGKPIKDGMNFGRWGWLDIGDVIDDADEAEASVLAEHPKFEEVTSAKTKVKEEAK